jgi:hypothetical protein
MGRERAALSFLGKLAAGDQHRNDDYHLLDGVSDPELTKPRRSGAANQARELIRASDAENQFIGIEKLSDKELDALHEQCVTAAEQTQARLERARGEREARKARSKQDA